MAIYRAINGEIQHSSCGRGRMADGRPAVQHAYETRHATLKMADRMATIHQYRRVAAALASMRDAVQAVLCFRHAPWSQKIGPSSMKYTNVV